MDIKAKIEEAVQKIKTDKALQKKFQEDPVGAVESILGVELPKDQVESVVNGIKAKIKLDGIGGALGGIFKK